MGRCTFNSAAAMAKLSAAGSPTWDGTLLNVHSSVTRSVAHSLSGKESAGRLRESTWRTGIIAGRRMCGAAERQHSFELDHASRSFFTGAPVRFVQLEVK